MRDVAIGIDLGTTFSAVSFCKDGKITVIHNDAGYPITPSVVHFGEKDQIVGEVALRKRANHPRRTISEIKRFIGRSHDDIDLKKRTFPFEVVRGTKGKACVRVDGDVYTPEEVSAIILGQMKTIATKYIENPKDVVITVPSNFTNVQRQATKDAGVIVGLNVLQIINEPTAAALAFCHAFPSNEKRKILVYDLGGGTFDVSIVESDGHQMTVLSTNGHAFLGGIDFDLRIYEEAVARFRGDDIDIPNGDWSLMDACEKAKRALARMSSVEINYTTKNGKQVGFSITQDTFVDICDDLFAQTIRLVEKTIKEARLSKADLDEIVLVGGSTRMQHVRKLMSDYFPGKKIRTDIEPDLAIAQGAAIMAASISAGTGFFEKQAHPAQEKFNRMKLIDVTPHSLGLRLAGDLMSIMIPKNTCIPYIMHEVYTNAENFERHLSIEIVEGEHDKASLNVELAKFRISVPPKMKNENSIKVRFAINRSGILEVTAIDEDTNKTVSITVQSGNLESEERAKMTRQLAHMMLKD